jgi:hypothetical protein
MFCEADPAFVSVSFPILGVSAWADDHAVVWVEMKLILVAHCLVSVLKHGPDSAMASESKHE